MRLFHGQNQDITRAGNWTPELLGNMAIARASEGVREKTQIAATQVLTARGFDRDELLKAWLSAKGSIHFGLEEVIAFFGDHHKFSRVHGAINDALIFLCMRIQIEEHRKKQKTPTRVGDILETKKAVQKRAVIYRTAKDKQEKAA